VVLDEAFVIRIDGELLVQGVPLHARPFNVALSYMKEAGISGDLLAEEIHAPIMAIYRSLYPSGDFAIPAVLVGGVAFRDQFYPVRVNVGYGTCRIDPLKCIEIDPAELDAIWRYHPHEVWRAMYAVADLWDLGYAIEDLRFETGDVAALCHQTRAAVTATARTLAAGGDADAVVQSSHLAAELGMKAALAKLGVQEPQRRALSHHLNKAVDLLTSKHPTTADEQLRRAVSGFPDYVKSRYVSPGLTRLQLADLAMKSQYAAANALRRVTGRNLAGKLERDPKNNPRAYP
jgi:HEPN domain-containing protein